MYPKVSLIMSGYYRYVFLSLLVIFGYSPTNSERLHKQIYSSIEGTAACFRRLNGTHQAGCSSTEKGAVGVVQMISDVSDAQWIVTNATAGPYMAVVSTLMFSNVIEVFMEYPDNIAGVLVYDNVTERATSFTEESRCPNEYSSGPGSQCSSTQAGGIVWNEMGTGLLRRDIPFPMLFVPKSRAEEIDKIRECYEKFNLDKSNQNGMPLCSVQLNSFMFAAVNSEVCLRRSTSTAFLTATKVCDPLGDQNVYYSLFPLIQKKGAKKQAFTLVTARFDTASLFDGVSPGAASSVVGMVTLLTAAVTLAEIIPVKDADLYDENVMFTLFNGESFDYIGSQRVAFDLSRGAWPTVAPLDVSKIKLHVELGQIGATLSQVTDNSWPLHTFAPYEIIPAEISNFVEEMINNLKVYNMSTTLKLTPNLPPSSIHSFRRILKNVTESTELPELLITDYQDTFTNMFYNSALDEYEKIGFVYRNITIDNGTFIPTKELIAKGNMTENDLQVKIARLATAFARTLYRRVSGTTYDGSIAASAHLVDEMLYCFLRSQSCELLKAANYAQPSNKGEEVSEKVNPLYVGVAPYSTVGPIFAGHLLALLAGPRMAANKTDCAKLNEPGFSYYWLSGWNHTGECVQTTMNFSQAISPAFIITDYDMSSGMYSSWTESVWQTMWARVFVRAGGGGARAAGFTGAATTILAILLTYFIKRYKEQLFTEASVVAVTDDATSGILRTVNC